MNASSYCPVRDALDPIANDLKRFAYMDGADIIQELQYSPVGLTAILTKTSGKSAPFKRQMGTAVILDNSLTVLDVLRHQLEADGYAAYWDRFAEAFVPIIADAQQIQVMIREKLADSNEVQNLRWVTGDSLANALAEIQGDAAYLHKVVSLIIGDLTERLKEEAEDFGEFTALMKWCESELGGAIQQKKLLGDLIRNGGARVKDETMMTDMGCESIEELHAFCKNQRRQINIKLKRPTLGQPWTIEQANGAIALKRTQRANQGNGRG